MLRGDVVALRSRRASRGHEQRGHRYGVVLQAPSLLVLSTVIVAPTSTAAHPAIFRPEINVAGRSTRVLVEHVNTVDSTRLGERVGHLSLDELRGVEDALRLVLELLP